MYKKIVFLGIILVFSTISAQKKSKEDAIRLIAEDTCECIKDDPELFSENTDLQRKEMGLGLCMLKSYNLRKKESKALRKSKLGLEELGEEVGVEMISICGVEFMELFSNEALSDYIDDRIISDPAPPPTPKNEDDLNITAKLIKLNNDVVSNITVEDDFGKKHNFIIVNQFEGDELLTNLNKNKQIIIYFKEANYYDLSEKRYIKKKVVMFIELQ